MTDLSKQRYEEVLMCDVRQDEGLIHIKVVAMPYQDPVEFNVAEARVFANRILAGIELLESDFGK